MIEVGLDFFFLSLVAESGREPRLSEELPLARVSELDFGMLVLAVLIFVSGRSDKGNNSCCYYKCRHRSLIICCTAEMIVGWWTRVPEKSDERESKRVD